MKNPLLYFASLLATVLLAGGCDDDRTEPSNKNSTRAVVVPEYNYPPRHGGSVMIYDGGPYTHVEFVSTAGGFESYNYYPDGTFVYRRWSNAYGRYD